MSCPAVWVRSASVADPAVEKALAAPAACRAEAQALFASLLRYFGWEPDGGGATLAGRVSDGRGGIFAGALVTLDGWYHAQTDDTGRFLFAGLDGRESHTIEVLQGGRVYGAYSATPGRNLEIVLEAD